MATDKRYCSFVLYPDVAPSNWVELLAQTGLPLCISPYHDHDLNPDGSPKRSHYHVMVCYSGSSAYAVVKHIVVDLLHRPLPIPVNSVSRWIEYFTHKYDPVQYQYLEEDITCLNGFTIKEG